MNESPYEIGHGPADLTKSVKIITEEGESVVKTFAGEAVIEGYDRGNILPTDEEHGASISMLLEHDFPTTTYVQPFDELVRIIPEKRESVISYLAQQIALIEKGKRKRKRRPEDEASFGTALEIIAANVVRCAASQKSIQGFRYSRKFDSYSKKSVYCVHVLKPKTFLKVIGLLGELRLLNLETGYRILATGESKQSTFIPTERLIETLTSLPVSAADTYSEPAVRPVLILKDSKKKLAEYDPETIGIRDHVSAVRRYNDLIKKQDLYLAVSDSEMIDLQSTPEKDGTARPPIDFSKISLYRVFNNSSWTQGGRHFGGWWQNVPARYRQRIMINGEPTVELDFSGFVGRAIYHSMGLQCQADPYEVPSIFEAAKGQGTPRETIRSTVKGMMIKLIYSRPGRSPGFKDAILPTGMTKKDACRLIYEYHEPIRSAFQSGIGYKISYAESQICEHVLSRAFSSSFVLPVFDSYIGPARWKGWLRQTMHDGYRKYLGGIPVIAEK